MENLSTLESFKSFRVSQQGMNSISGGRSRYFTTQDFDSDGDTECVKIIDDNSGATEKKKLKPDSRCD